MQSYLDLLAERFARAAPFGGEVDHHQLAFGFRQLALEILLQNQNSIINDAIS